MPEPGRVPGSPRQRQLDRTNRGAPGAGCRPGAMHWGRQTASVCPVRGARRWVCSRRRIWLDARDQRFSTLDELNAWLGERCKALWAELRHPEHKAFSVAEMLELERQHLMPMPAPFDGYVQEFNRVSSTCLVTVARNRYSVRVSWYRNI